MSIIERGKMEEFYPGTKVRITDPTFFIECQECGYQSIALLPSIICQKCGGVIECITMPEKNKQKNSA